MSDGIENRLFLLSGYSDDFTTGICADGRQVVMGLLCPHLVAYFFGSNGEIAGGERKLWKHPAPLSENNSHYLIYDFKFQVAIAEQMSEWQQEIGFCQSIITIQEFFDDTYPVGISILPDDLEQDEIEAIEDPEERGLVEVEKKDWLASGQFVWWWAKDYCKNSGLDKGNERGHSQVTRMGRNSLTEKSHCRTSLETTGLNDTK